MSETIDFIIEKPKRKAKINENSKVFWLARNLKWLFIIAWILGFVPITLLYIYHFAYAPQPTDEVIFLAATLRDNFTVWSLLISFLTLMTGIFLDSFLEIISRYLSQFYPYKYSMHKTFISIGLGSIWIAGLTLIPPGLYNNPHSIKNIEANDTNYVLVSFTNGGLAHSYTLYSCDSDAIICHKIENVSIENSTLIFGIKLEVSENEVLVIDYDGTILDRIAIE